MIRRILWVLGGLAWGGVSTLVGVYATFPEDAARDRLEYEFHRATNKEMALDIGDLSLWRMSGADLSDVKVYTVKRGRRTKDDPKPPMERSQVLHFDRLAVRAALLPTLMGKKAAAFAASIYDGELDGTWAVSDRTVEVAFDVAGVDLSQMPVKTDVMELSLLGKLEGACDLVLDTEDVKSSSGSMHLSFPGVGLAKGSKVAGFELPEVVFDKAVVSGEVKDGKLEITEGSFESSVITATLSGDIALNKKLGRSRNRLELTFTLPEDIDQLAQVAPDMKRARDADGVYHFLVTGTLLSPHARPSRGGARAAGLRDGGDREAIGPAAGLGDRLGGDVDPSSMTDEERRARREERIRERRERLRKRREEEAARGESVGGGGMGGGMKDRDFPAGREFDPNGGGDLPPGMDDIPPFGADEGPGPGGFGGDEGPGPGGNFGGDEGPVDQPPDDQPE